MAEEELLIPRRLLRVRGKSGEFSISNWDGYPNGPKPSGPFRVVNGEEYQNARSAAYSANRAIHQANPNLKGMQIHEIQPVKFGGSPTDPTNKIALKPAEHMQYTNWWNSLLRYLNGK